MMINYANKRQDNILFGNAFDQELYNKCIEACDLTEDIMHLAGGDEYGRKLNQFDRVNKHFFKRYWARRNEPFRRTKTTGVALPSSLPKR